MALEISKVTVDPSEEYASRADFHFGYADVSLLPLLPEEDAILIERDCEAGTAIFVATDGVWSDEPDSSGEVYKLPVFIVKFRGVDDRNIEDCVELASFAAFDASHGYSHANCPPEFVARYEAAKAGLNSPPRDEVRTTLASQRGKGIEL